MSPLAGVDCHEDESSGILAGEGDTILDFFASWVSRGEGACAFLTGVERVARLWLERMASFSALMSC